MVGRVRSFCAFAVAWALLLLAPGCVHVYEPLSGLHRPVVVDPTVANFQDVRLTVVCPPGGMVDRTEARLLCEKVGKLFENQGATVVTDADATVRDATVEATAPAPSTDLVLELRSREIHSSNDPLSWLVCLGTATLVPAVTESTFAQDVVIRDGTGFLLVSDTLTGRIVRRFGVGTWAGNWLLDRIWRKPEDELTQRALQADLSADLYGQLSQLVFNAKMRWQVLREATPTGRATGGAP